MRKTNLLLLLAGLAILVLTGCLETFSSRTAADDPQSLLPAKPLLKTSSRPGAYIVTLNENVDVDAVVNELKGRHGLGVGHVYHFALKGFSAVVPSGRLQALQNDPRVASVEEDLIVYALDQSLPWGIDRIDVDISSTLAGNGSGDVTGVRIYIIDTGIKSDHPDLQVIGLHDFTGTGDGHDDNGHGTHVAGIAAGRDDTSFVVGAAPGAPLVAIKVLGADGSGWTSDIVAGIDFVTADKLANLGLPMVANMSLGGRSATKTAIDAAVQRSINSGVVFCVAAGNDGVDAKNFTPAHVLDAITVAAYDNTNRMASWSNYGTLIDLQAPGVAILSDWFDPAVPTTVLSGTSMATPHVTGVAALYLSRNPGKTPKQVRDQLVANGKPWVTGLKPKTTNISLYAGVY